MSTYQGDEECLTCGQNYIYEFNLKTGVKEKVTCCACDTPRLLKVKKLLECFSEELLEKAELSKISGTVSIAKEDLLHLLNKYASDLSV